MSDIGKKRLEATFAIASYAVGSGTATGAPTPGVELPKQLILTISDISMYFSIWKIYFEEDLSSKGLTEMLTDLGLIAIAATGSAYVVTKTSTALVSEITDWLGPVGWGVSAVIAGSLTGLSGSAWAVYCDYLYSKKIGEVEVI